MADMADLDPGAVVPQTLLDLAFHDRLCRFVHVDEVDDDQSCKIA